MKYFIKKHPYFFVALFWLFISFALSSCSTSRATYGNSGSHGWGTESRCGKKKPGKWQRYHIYETNRDGTTRRVKRPQCVDNW